MSDRALPSVPCRQRLRIRFRKENDLRWIGHRDLARAFERLVRRARLALRMSEGYHPKPKINFPSALALGIEGLDEVVELELAEPADPPDVLRRLALVAPAGLTVTSVRTIESGVPKPRVRAMHYRFPVPAARQPRVRQGAEDLLAQATLPFRREGRSQPVDLRADLTSLEVRDGALLFCIGASHHASVRPGDVLTLLGLTDLQQQGYFLTRTAVELAS